MCYFLGVFAGASRYTRAAPISRSSLAAAAADAPVVMMSSTNTTDLPRTSAPSSGSSARGVFLPRGKILLRGLRGRERPLAQRRLTGQAERRSDWPRQQLGLIVAAPVQVHKADRHIGDEIGLPVLQPLGEQGKGLRGEPVRIMLLVMEFEPLHGIFHLAGVGERSRGAVHTRDMDGLRAAVFFAHLGRARGAEHGFPAVLRRDRAAAQHAVVHEQNAHCHTPFQQKTAAAAAVFQILRAAAPFNRINAL